MLSDITPGFLVLTKKARLSLEQTAGLKRSTNCAEGHEPWESTRRNRRLKVNKKHNIFADAAD